MINDDDSFTYNSMVDSDMFMMHNLDNIHVQFSTYIFMKENFKTVILGKTKLRKFVPQF